VIRRTTVTTGWQVIRHYHGHLSGVYSMALHPSLDVLMTGGRDSVCRVWDMRSKTQVRTRIYTPVPVSGPRWPTSDPASTASKWPLWLSRSADSLR